MQSRIFVSIASYCDPDLNSTIRSLFEKASFPDRLHVGVVKQGGTPLDNIECMGGKLTVVDIAPIQSGGACWARSLAMSLYRNEDFFLQIDSHTYFDDHWDVTLIDTLARQFSRSAKPIISTRPFDYEEDCHGNITTKRFTDKTIRLLPKSSSVSLDSPVILFSAISTNTTDDLIGYQLAANFLFTTGSFIREIPYDPFLYFHGEEQDLSIRSLTRGWDIIHPNCIPLYHKYKKRLPGEPVMHWDLDLDGKRAVQSSDRKKMALAILKMQLLGLGTGPYCPGTERTVDFYLKNLGLNLVRS